jgi:hypothetical protein
MGGTQADKGRNQIGAVGIVDRLGKGTDVRRFRDDAQFVAQPLNGGSGDEDAPLESELRPLANVPGGRREETVG